MSPYKQIFNKKYNVVLYLQLKRLRHIQGLNVFYKETIFLTES